MIKTDKSQFNYVATKLYDYAVKLEKEGAKSDVISMAMAQVVAFYAIKRLGKSDAAKWLSDSINVALEGIDERT